MKKFSLLTVTLLLVVLVGPVFARQAKFGFEVKYENFQHPSELFRPQVVIPERKQGFYANRTLSLWEGRETISRLLLETSLSFPGVRLFGVMGAGTVNFVTTPTFSWESGCYEPPYSEFRNTGRGSKLFGTSDWGFIGGGGTELSLRGKHASVSLLARYLYQSLDNCFLLFFQQQKTEVFGPGYEITSTQKATIRKSQAEEILLRLTVSGDVDRFSAAFGPEVCVLNVEHSGVGLVGTTYGKKFGLPDFQQETGFCFQTRGESVFGLYARIECKTEENCVVFVEGHSGAIKGATVGAKFKL